MGSKSPLPRDLDLTQVNGVKVEGRTPAKMKLHGVALKNAREFGRSESGEVRGVDEILLADGRILYQCVARPGACGQTYENVASARSHQQFHRGRGAVQRQTTEITELRTEVARLRRSAAGQAAAKTRAARKATPAADVAAGHVHTAAVNAATTYPTRAAAVKALKNDHVELKPSDWAEIQRAVRQHTEAIGTAVNQLVSIITTLAANGVVDPTVAEKARKYDDLVKLLPRS